MVELVGLRDDALDLAGRRLPAAISRLRAGGTVDLDQAAPLPDAGQIDHIPGSRFDDEIGQVAEALAVVQRAALEAAVERAEMVGGVARIFLNLARRSQILVHRQLALLDAMERRVADPAEIEDLFRLDHLATRMRRHAESLIILSGAGPRPRLAAAGAAAGRAALGDRRGRGLRPGGRAPGARGPGSAAARSPT